MVLHLGREDDLLPGQESCNPVSGPAPLRDIVDAGQRLEGNGLPLLFAERASEVVPIPTHRERRGADGTAEVEGEYLRLVVAPELQRHEGQQHGLARARRADNERMADISDMQGEPERRCPLGPAEEQRRRIEVLIRRRTGPDRRQWDHVRQVERRDRRLSHVGVGMPGKGTKPGIDGIDPLHHAGEVAALDHLLDETQPFVGNAGILIPDRDGHRAVGGADRVRAELLERRIGVDGLIVRIGVDERRCLVGHDLLEDSRDGLPLGEPLTAYARQQPGGVGLVEEDRPRRPAVSEGQTIEFVEQPRRGGSREAHDREHPQMAVAELRLQTARQGPVGQQSVEVHGHLRHAHALASSGNAGMEIGQGLPVVEPVALGHEAVEELQHPFGAIGEPGQNLTAIRSRGAAAAFIEKALGTGRFPGRRQIQKGQVIGRLVMRPLLLERGLALGVDQRRRRVRKPSRRVDTGRQPLGLDEEGPTRSKTTEDVVQPSSDADEFRRHCRVEIGAAETRGPLERAVLVQDDAGSDERCPRQKIGKAGGRVPVFGEIHH